MSVLVLCPTRDRPVHLVRFVESVMQTSQAKVAIYIDDDQRELYRDAVRCLPETHGRVRVHFGPRVGPIEAVNLLAYGTHEDAYGYVPDDCVFTVAGWDRWVLDRMKEFPGGVGCVSPRDNLGTHIDMPFISGAWYEALGWVCYPQLYHWCWPTVTGILGEFVGIVKATPGEFFIRHDHTEPSNQDKQSSDMRQLYAFFGYGRFQTTVAALRKAQKENER